MKITIHRGINQIGGCITEIATKNNRILIDLGQNLPDNNGEIHDNLANVESVAKITKDVDAIFYTHYHGDHSGLFHFVPDTTKQYIGQVAKQVILRKHQQLAFIPEREALSMHEISKIEQMCTFVPMQVVEVGDIRITPFFVSHSAYDAYMFLIEANNKRILHTGDFRGHGYLSKGTIQTIKTLILSKGKIDFLITEGTMLSRLKETVLTELELKNEVIDIMKNYKNVFVMCSSTDLERLATFHAANKETNRGAFICDEFQHDILDIFTNTAGKKSTFFNFADPYIFNKKNTKLISWMQDRGFCMLVRATEKFENYLNDLLPLLKESETVLIFSMWKEYINPESKHNIGRYSNFVSKFPAIKKVHTSGHASASFLAEACTLINPISGIIPIHSECSKAYQNLPISNELKMKVITTSKMINETEVVI